ncbi:MAG: hypothetical protein Q7S89_02630 [bacterium]|nr:hypothetical protein [bacterium]
MSPRLRTILVSCLFIGVIGGIAWGMYALFFRSSSPVSTPTPPPAQVSPQVPDFPTTGIRTPVTPVDTGGTDSNQPKVVTPDLVARGGVTTIRSVSGSSALFPIYRTGTNDIVTYDRAKGQFFKTPLSGGAVTPLADRRFPQAVEAIWSPTGNQVIVGFPDEAKVYYDFSAGKQATIPKQWEEIAFSKDGGQIAFKVMNDNPDKRWFAYGKPDGSEVNLVEPLGREAEKFIVSWSPNQQVAGLFNRPKGFSRQEVFLVGLHGENFKSMLVEGSGLLPQWSPDGAQLLYSVHPYDLDQGLKPELWVVDASPETIGQNRIQLNVQTWADKCVFEDAGHLLCAVPRELPRGAGPYRSLADDVPDDFYRVDTSSGLKTVIAQPDHDVRAENLQVMDAGQRLIFTDALSGEVSELRLQ